MELRPEAFVVIIINLLGTKGIKGMSWDIRVFCVCYTKYSKVVLYKVLYKVLYSIIQSTIQTIS